MGNHRIPLQGTRRQSLLLSCLSASYGQLPAFLAKPFSFTLLSKNAPANHLESHSCKNKGLKVPCFHTLTKNIGGRRAPHQISYFQLSTLDFQLSPVSHLTSTLTKNTSATPLASTLTRKPHFKPFRINTYKKGGEGDTHIHAALLPVTGHQRPAVSARISLRMSPDALISVRDLAKHFRTFKRREGLRGGFINLFHRD